MADAVSAKTDDFSIQRNLLLATSIAALLILAPDFKGLELNLAVVHLKIENAIFIRGLIFLTLAYLVIRYWQAGRPQFSRLELQGSFYYKSVLSYFGIEIHKVSKIHNVISFKSSTRYVCYINDTANKNKFPDKYNVRKPHLDEGNLNVTSGYKSETVTGLKRKVILAQIFISKITSILLSPVFVPSVLEYLFPYLMVVFVLLELCGIHLFRDITGFIGSLFPDPSALTALPQTESCLETSRALDLLEAYRHALLSLER